MSDAMIAINPFLDRMPRELHEQYMMDCSAEYTKIAETNKTTDDSVISFKYDLIVAFAKKPRKLPPCIGRCLQIPPISEGRLVTIHPTTHTNTTHKIVHYSCVE